MWCSPYPVDIAGSGSSTLTFAYTVASNDTNTSDLKVAGYTGSIRDSAGSYLVVPGVVEDTHVQIDTIVPSVSVSLVSDTGSNVSPERVKPGNGA